MAADPSLPLDCLACWRLTGLTTNPSLISFAACYAVLAPATRAATESPLDGPDAARLGEQLRSDPPHENGGRAVHGQPLDLELSREPDRAADVAGGGAVGAGVVLRIPTRR